jgi:hypothetical protein
VKLNLEQLKSGSIGNHETVENLSKDENLVNKAALNGVDSGFDRQTIK